MCFDPTDSWERKCSGYCPIRINKGKRQERFNKWPILEPRDLPKIVGNR
jgi:hypothetical protein